MKSGAPADAVLAPPEMSDGLTVATPEAVQLRTDALRRCAGDHELPYGHGRAHRRSHAILREVLGSAGP